MSLRPFLGLVPLGHVDLQMLQHLRTAIAEFLSLPVRILPPRPLPPNTYHLPRNQYHSTQLLEYLLVEDHDGAFRVLGITTADLYIPIFTFVFGEAQLDGKAAIISTFRPGGGADNLQPGPPIVMERLIKLSLHELGHTFNLPHCREEGCLMGFAANLEILDRKNVELCEYCRILLVDYFNAVNGL
jgi:archaemetzincin